MLVFRRGVLRRFRGSTDGFILLLKQPPERTPGSVRTYSLQASSEKSSDPTLDADEWRRRLIDDPAGVVQDRYNAYKQLRATPADAGWMLAIFEAIPAKRRRYADYSFALKVMLASGFEAETERFLVDLAASQPVWWETLYIRAIPEMQCGLALRVFVGACIARKEPMGDLRPQQHAPLFEALQIIANTNTTTETVEALDALLNPVAASPLASLLMDAICLRPANNAKRQLHNDGLADPNQQGQSDLSAGPPFVHTNKKFTDNAEVISSDNAELYAARTSQLVESLWTFKVSRQWASSRDLHRLMLHRIRCGNAKDALSVYDEHPELHDVHQSDALLLAAGKTRDWIRLQTVFDFLDSPGRVSELGSRHYALVLQALGHLGGRELLEDVYRGFLAHNPPIRPTRGVFHALIHSFCVLGLVEDARKYFHLMTDTHHIVPTRVTFVMLLQAYRDAQDLRGALDVVGNLMLDGAGLPLSNRELTTLLSLCSRRHDHQAGWRIWKWATKALAIKPDLRSYNAMLSCLIESNQLSAALELWEAMPWRSHIDTLTILLGYTARYAGPHDLFERIADMRVSENIKPDARYFLAVMKYWLARAEPQKVQETFKEMKRLSLSASGDHYRVLMESAGRGKQFDEAERVYDIMSSSNVPQTFGSIEERLRMLTRPSSTPEMHKLSTKLAGRIIIDGVFDETADIVPRTRLPARVLRPTIRNLIKAGDASTAERLLTAYRALHGEELHLWALELELQEKKGNFTVIDQLWLRFMNELRKKFVLADCASSAESKGPAQKSKYILAPRHRKTFWRQVNIKMADLARHKQVDELLRFPEYLVARGFELTKENRNAWLQALLEVGLVEKAFDHAHAASPRSISDKTYGALYSNYGALIDALRAAEIPNPEEVAKERYGRIVEWIHKREFERQTVNITSWTRLPRVLP